MSNDANRSTPAASQPTHKSDSMNPEDPQGNASGGSNRQWLVLVGVGCAGMLLVCVLIAGVLVVVSSDDDEVAAATPTVQATEALAQEPAAEATATAEPTLTPEPTTTPEPSPTPAPTATPAPTPTPEPTPSPEPTTTPEPTATPESTPTPQPPPEPVWHAGYGDDVINIEKPGGPDSAALVHVRGNAEARHFAITAYDAAGQYVGLLVNTTEPYEGLVPLDFDDLAHSTQLEINAPGEWEIEIRPIEMIELFEVPGEVVGSGDYVFAIAGTSNTALVEGNAAERHFAVMGWGDRWHLMVNTVEPYQGRVRVAPDIVAIEVVAVGEWRMVFE